MKFFIVLAIIYHVLYARLLMTAGIDRRLPLGITRLNLNRVPRNAIWTQTGISVVITGLIFFVFPLFTFLGDPAELTNKAYLVTAGALLLVWAFSFLFPFADLLIILLREPRNVLARLSIVPRPILLCCIIVGSFVCIATIVDTLLFSFAPPLIPNGSWTVTIGIFAFICMSLCAVTGMVASSETDIEQFKFDEAELQSEIAKGKSL
jgi:hypothetical protein